MSARSGKNISFGTDSAHTVSDEEKAGFVDYINTLLRDDADLQEQRLVPLDPQSDQIYQAVESGLLLAKLVNAVAPNAVDMKKINKKSTLSTFNKSANINVVLAAAKEIGVQVTNVGAEDIMEGRPHLVLGIIWQVLRVGLETQMRRNIEALGLSGFKNLRSAQEILLKWVNDSIAAQGCKRTARNLSGDIADSEIYAYLLKSIDPSVDPAAILANADHTARAEGVLKAAERLGLKRFVQPADIVSGSQRLNFAFVANLFNNAKHAKPAAAEPSAQPNREAELLAIIERLQIENEALKRENERLRQGEEEGSKLKRRVVELESNAQSANLAAELDQLKQQLADAEQARNKLAEQSAASASAGQLAQELQGKLAAQEEANRQLQQELQAKESTLRKLKEEEEAELAKLKGELSAQEDKLKAQMKEKEEEMERLRSQMSKTEAASAEQRNLEEQLRAAELALQDYEDRLKAIAAEDFVQKKALEEKQDNLMSLPLSAIRNGKERFSGWLHKSGNKNKSQWKKRYCVLRDNYLFYYHTDNDKKEKQGKWVRLNGAKVETIGDREKDKKRHLFVIHPHQDVPQGDKEKAPEKEKAKPKAPQYYEFFGADEAEMNQWVNMLNTQIGSLGPVPGPEVARASLYRTQTIRKEKGPMLEGSQSQPSVIAADPAAKLEPIGATEAAKEAPAAPAAAAPAAAAVAEDKKEGEAAKEKPEKKKDGGVLGKITSIFTGDEKKEKEKEGHKDAHKDAHKAEEKKEVSEEKKEGEAKEGEAKKEGEKEGEKKEKKEKKKKEKKDDSSKSDSKEEKKDKKEKKKKEKKDDSSSESKEKDEKKDKEHKEGEKKEEKHEKKEKDHKDGGVMGKITSIFIGDEKKEKEAHKESPHAHAEEAKDGTAPAAADAAAAAKAAEPASPHKEEKDEAKKKEKEEKEAKKAAEKEREAKEKAEKKAKKEQEKREHEAKKEAERKEHEERKQKEKEEKEARKAAEAQEREAKKAAEKARKSDGKGDAPVGSPAEPKKEEPKKEEAAPEAKKEEAAAAAEPKKEEVAEEKKAESAQV